MANRIKGITVAIGGDTIDLQKSLKDVNKVTASLQSELNQVNHQLKFDPSSTVLLSQKQDVLKEAIEASKDKLKQLEDVQEDIERQYKNGEIDNGQYRAYQREVEQTKDKIKSFENQLEATQKDIRELGGETNLNQLNSELDGVKNKAKSASKSITSDLQKAGKVALGASAAIGAVGAAVYKLTKSAADNADTIDKQSQNMNLSRKTYQELEFVMSQCGADISNMKIGMKTLISVMDTTAAGTSKTKTALEELGISATDSNGQLRNSEEVMWDVFTKLQKVENQTLKSRLAVRLFGKAGSNLMPMLNSSSKSIEEMRKQAHSLGLVLDNETINSGVEFTDTLDQAERATQALQTRIGAKLAPVITDLLREFEKNLPEIQNMAEILGEEISSDIKWAIEHGDIILKVLKAIGIETVGIYTAIKLNSATKYIVETVNALRTLKTTTDAVKVATEGATVAQAAFNTAEKANVIGAVVSGLVILGTTLWSVYELTKDNTEATDEFNRSTEKLMETMAEEVKAWDEIKTARKKSFSNVNSEFGYYSDLSRELNKITKKNGEIKKGYEERAQVIATTLNNALGTEITLNGNVVQSYKEVQKEIKRTIAVKKAEAQLSADQEAYDTALQNKKPALENLNNAKIDLANYQEQQKKLKSKLAETKKEYDIVTSNSSGESVRNSPVLEKYQKLLSKINSVNGKISSTKENIKDYQDTYLSYVNTIENHTNLLSAIENGSIKDINKSINNVTNSFITAENGTYESLSNQLDTAKKDYQNLKALLKDGMPGVSKSDVEKARKYKKQVKAELDDYNANIEEILNKLNDEFITAENVNEKTLRKRVKNCDKALKDLKRAYKEGAPNVDKEAINNAKTLKKQAMAVLKAFKKEAKDNADETGENAGNISNPKNKQNARRNGKEIKEHHVAGLKVTEDDKNTIENSYKSLINRTGSKANQDLAKSKSKSLARNFVDGFLNFLNSDNILSKAFNAGWNFVSQALSGIQKGQDSNSPSKKSAKLAQDNADGFILRLLDNKDKSYSAGVEMAKSALKGIKEAQINSVEKAKYNSNAINSRLASLSSSGVNLRNDSKVINNSPTVHVSFGNVTVRNNQDINAIADAVTDRVSENLANIVIREDNSYGG